MANVHRLGLILTVSAFLHISAAEKCIEFIFGNITDYSFQVIPMLVMPPGQSEAAVVLSDVCDLAGMSVKACDADSAPGLWSDKVTEVIVVRSGNLKGWATVDTVGFCKNAQGTFSEELGVPR